MCVAFQEAMTMNALPEHTKITQAHRERKAMIYLRQSSPKQVQNNLESQRLQYAMTDRARNSDSNRLRRWIATWVLVPRSERRRVRALIT